MEYLEDLQFRLIEYSYEQTDPSKNRIDNEYAKSHGIKKVDAAFAEKTYLLREDFLRMNRNVIIGSML